MIKSEQRQTARVKEGEAARYIGMSCMYLRISRCEGHRQGRTPGPPYYKIGRSVRYDLADLDRWLEQRRVDPGSE